MISSYSATTGATATRMVSGSISSTYGNANAVKLNGTIWFMEGAQCSPSGSWSFTGAYGGIQETYAVNSASYSTLYNRGYVETDTASYAINSGSPDQEQRLGSWDHKLSGSGADTMLGTSSAVSDNWNVSFSSQESRPRYSDCGGTLYTPRAFDFPLNTEIFLATTTVSGQIMSSEIDYQTAAPFMPIASHSRTLFVANQPTEYTRNMAYEYDPVFLTFVSKIDGTDKWTYHVIASLYAPPGPDEVKFTLKQIRSSLGTALPYVFTASTNGSSFPSYFAQATYGAVTRNQGSVLYTSWEPIGISTSVYHWTQTQGEAMPIQAKNAFNSVMDGIRSYDRMSLIPAFTLP